MGDRYQTLGEIPIIADIKKVEFDDEIRSSLIRTRGKAFADFVEERNRVIDIHQITYESNDHHVVGFTAEPKGGNNLPCLICNRGGSKDFGAWTPAGVSSQLGLFASWGYMTITTQYSGNGGSEGKDEFGGSELNDVLTLYQVLKHYRRADTNRIGMFGASRGGMMTYLTLACVTWLRAAVTQAGEADLFRGFTERPKLKAWISDMFDVNDEKELRKRSAVFWTERFCKTTPLLLLHGTSDWRVSVLNSLDMAVKLYQNRIPYRLVIFEGADHGITEFNKERLALTKEWFERYVMHEAELPNLNPHGD
ncbi:MAG: alpha/beta hydrolase family protein [Armatimonadota bacterium]